jgi:hypothetical protein
MADTIPVPSKSEAGMIDRLRELVGIEAFNNAPPIFGGAAYCLMEAARCYDVWAFSASCVMSRSALETAFLAFSTSKRTGEGWRIIKPQLKPTGKLRNRTFEYWYARTRRKVRFSRELRESIKLIQIRGNRSVHYGQKLIEEYWGQVTEVAKWKNRGKSPPVISVSGLSSSLDAYRSLIGATEVLGFLVRHKFAAPNERDHTNSNPPE